MRVIFLSMNATGLMGNPYLKSKRSLGNAMVGHVYPEIRKFGSVRIAQISDASTRSRFSADRPYANVTSAAGNQNRTTQNETPVRTSGAPKSR